MSARDLAPPIVSRSGRGAPERLLGAGRAIARVAGRVPRAARVCFLIALVNSAVWGFVVPPFQVPDEIAHFGYSQYLAEHGSVPPKAGVPEYSREEQIVLQELHFVLTIGKPSLRGVLTPAENRAMHEAIAANREPSDGGGTDSITDQPPLYYALTAVPYWLSPSGEILARLQAIRLLSALLAALTVLAVFMFLRELFPRSPWAWTTGALVAAFQPMFDFISAGVQGDNLLFCVSAWLLFLLLRTYKRGLDGRSGLAIGLVTLAGLLTKLNFIGLVPGVALAMALLLWRARRGDRARLVRGGAGMIAAPLILFGLYALVNAVVWHRGGPFAGGVTGATTGTVGTASGQRHVVTLKETLDYTWELYLPPLWFMNHVYFPKYPGWELWLNALVGHFGWLDYNFPKWVYEWARWIFWTMSALGIVALVRARRQLPALLPIFLCFGVMALGMLGSIGFAGLRYRESTGQAFEQGRYLLPMLTFWGAFAVLAAKGVGRRFAPALAGVLVVSAMTLALFAETLTISRYYG
jgi:4-amino-4-deoxy-L-arabinose transferase-like glycosyltransferase